MKTQHERKLWSHELYEAIIAMGVKMDSHESDLYIPVTKETKALVAQYEYKENVTTFKSQIDGAIWFDVPFAFIPFWEARRKVTA